MIEDSGVDHNNNQLDDEIFQQVCNRAFQARQAQSQLAASTTIERNQVLLAIADRLEEHADNIAQANEKDIEAARKAHMDEGKIDRLLFNQERIKASARDVRHVASLPDPLGSVVRGSTMPNGIRLEQVRVPIGVLGMIYEARPNVTVDVASLSLKSGNAVLLRGGHAAEHTNATTLRAISQALEDCNFSSALVQSVDDFGRQGATSLMQARGFVDLLIPRGGAGLIRTVVENSKVPVIETGSGNVHIYVDESANLEQAVPIILNAKTQRVGVCNAAEKLLVHESVAQQFLPVIARELSQAGVELRVDDQARRIIETAGLEHGALLAANEQDWDTEYLALRIAIKVVANIEEAVAHINAHSTGHTEAILSQNYSAVEYFTHHIDSAVIMVNASTRFTDGGQFGFGAELGISTQKMHARGPMGLQEMTTTQWIGYGNGQVRP